MYRYLSLTVGLLGAASTTVAQMSLAQNYSGSSFFSQFNFVNGIDSNFGNVLYQTQTQAQQEGLISINSAGNAVIKIDNTTNGANDPTFGRPSVQLFSNQPVTAGSLMIMDALHIPYGCSVWPAFWLRGQNWPDNGEIDIIENVNLATQNQFSLHTLNGCTHPPASANVNETGTLVSTDCFNQTNGNQGCLVQAPQNSFGAGFAQNGGGVYAMLWDDTGIKLWFFPRASVPSDAASANPNPANWPAPTAFYPQSSCDTSKFFGPQTIIINIDVCGAFAGVASVFSPACGTGVCTDLVADPSNYNTAYYEISYIHVFSTSNSSSSNSSSGSGTSTSGAPKTTGSGSGSSGSNSGSPHVSVTTALLSMLAGAGIALVALF